MVLCSAMQCNVHSKDSIIVLHSFALRNKNASSSSKEITFRFTERVFCKSICGCICRNNAISLVWVSSKSHAAHMLQQPPQRKEFLKLLSLKMRELVLSMVTGRHELVIRGHWQTDSSIPNCCLQNDAVADEDSQFSRYLKILKSLANQFEVCRGSQIHRNWSYIYRSTSSNLSNLCIFKWMLLLSCEYIE